MVLKIEGRSQRNLQRVLRNSRSKREVLSSEFLKKFMEGLRNSMGVLKCKYISIVLVEYYPTSDSIIIYTYKNARKTTTTTEQ